MTQTTLPSRKRLEKKNCYKPTVNIRDVIKHYYKTYGTPTNGGCNSKIVRAVINEFNAFLADEIIRGEKIVLPYNLGTLEVSKRKQNIIIKDDKVYTKTMQVDWPNTWEYWKKNPVAAENKKLIYYINDHSDNFRFKIRWDKYGIKSSKIFTYSFKPSRLLSRKLAAHLLDPETNKNYSERC